MKSTTCLSLVNTPPFSAFTILFTTSRGGLFLPLLWAVPTSPTLLLNPLSPNPFPPGPFPPGPPLAIILFSLSSIANIYSRFDHFLSCLKESQRDIHLLLVE